MFQLPLTIPRDPWPRFQSDGATRAAIALLYALVLLLALTEVGRSIVRADRLDYTYYPKLGEVVLSGGDPYANDYNSWPPFFLLVAAALALGARVSATATIAVWQVVSVLAAWGTLKLLTRCFDDRGGEVTFWPRSPDRLAFVSAPVIVPFLFAVRLLQDNLQHGQINTQLLFLSLLAFVLFRERRPIPGALALALAASIKATPVLLLGYLVYKGCWRELGWTIAFLVLLNVVVPTAIFGTGEVATQWRAWRAVIGAVVQEPAAHHPNQALLSALKRFLTAQGGANNPLPVAIAAWPTATVVRLYWALASLGAVGLVLAFRHNPRDLSDRRSAGEFAICLAAMTLVSPIAWTAHYVTLVAPAAFAWWGIRALPAGRAARWRTALCWVSFACITLSASGFVGWAWARQLETLSAITLGALILVAVALSLLPTLTPRPAERAMSV